MTRAPRRPSLLALLLAGCAANGDGAAGGPVAFVAEVAFEAGEKLGGCAAGEVLRERAGDELVAVGVSGSVYLVREERSGWRGERIGAASGEAIQVAVGDLDPAYPGDEVLAVGMLAGDEDSGGMQNEFTQRNTTFMTWNLMHMARLLREAGGFPAHGNQRKEWDAGCRFDHPNPDYR